MQAIVLCKYPVIAGDVIIKTVIYVEAIYVDPMIHEPLQFKVTFLANDKVK
jgi:hypothetical protein